LTAALTDAGAVSLWRYPITVMPGLVPGIHALLLVSKKGVDGRDKPGHDAERYCT